MKPFESTTLSSSDAIFSRMNLVRQACASPHKASVDGSINRDSLVYLAQFVLGETSNLFHVSGAVRCSGGTAEQLGRIVKLLEAFSQNVVPAAAFVEQVEEQLSITVRPIQAFPAQTKQPTEDELLLAEENERHMRDQTRIRRERAQEDEDLDRAIADLMGVSVVKIEDEWGWQREDTGERFSPTSDSALAFELIQLFQLDIAFHASDVAVTFYVAHYDPSSYSVYTSNLGGSLARAITVAVYRKAVLQNRIT